MDRQRLISGKPAFTIAYLVTAGDRNPDVFLGLFTNKTKNPLENLNEVDLEFHLAQGEGYIDHTIEVAPENVLTAKRSGDLIVFAGTINLEAITQQVSGYFAINQEGHLFAIDPSPETRVKLGAYAGNPEWFGKTFGDVFADVVADVGDAVHAAGNHVGRDSAKNATTGAVLATASA